VPVPIEIGIAFTTNSQGKFTLNGIHGGIGPVDVYVQCVVIDASQPGGLAFTNAVKVQFLP